MSDELNLQNLIDPTPATTALLIREIAALKELSEANRENLKVKLDAMDKAITVAHDDLVRVPTETQKAVENLKRLHDERFQTLNERFKTVDVQFKGVDKQFQERDVRTDKAESAATTAVNAALQAQKESAQKQAEAFSEATSKSEQQFTKQSDQQSELLRTEVRGLRDQIDELKDRFNRGEGKDLGISGHRNETRLNTNQLISFITLMIAVVVVILDLVFKH